MPPSAPLAQRFKSKFKVMPSGCWEWTGERGHGGYGTLKKGIRAGKGKLRAHRVSYELHKGPIPEGLMVMHTCDNPPCVNPDHLVAGTALDNNRDARAKGRWVVRCGEKAPHVKLTIENVRHIRKCVMTRLEYAALYNVRVPTIRVIQIGKSWAGIL